MALVEVNNIENYGSSGGWDWKSLLAVLFGYLLKLLTDEILKKRDQKNIGKLFEYELFSFKGQFKKQLSDIRLYTEKTNLYDYTNITSYFIHKFDLIKALDKLTLVKFYKRKYKTGSSTYISKILNNIDLVYLELKRYEDFYTEYSKQKDDFIFNYKTNLDKIRRSVTSQEQYTSDIYIKKFTELYIKYISNTPLDLKYIISLENTFHLQLLQEMPTNNNHPLYNNISEFNFKGKDLIQTFKMKTEKQI